MEDHNFLDLKEEVLEVQDILDGQEVQTWTGEDLVHTSKSEEALVVVAQKILMMVEGVRLGNELILELVDLEALKEVLPLEDVAAHTVK
jgi:hypothetical protein